MLDGIELENNQGQVDITEIHPFYPPVQRFGIHFVSRDLKKNFD